ncbi:MAG: hypothetical protein JWN04_5652 [Myxococcaceae bacterium]|nr:hypothetical protein [Myxococcaceae bacterium]
MANRGLEARPLNSADADECRGASDRRLGLSLLALCAFIACAELVSLACPGPHVDHGVADPAVPPLSGGSSSWLSQPGARFYASSEAAPQPAWALAHATARLASPYAALPDCEVREPAPEEGEQDASLHGPAVGLAGGSAPLSYAAADVPHVRRMAWPLQDVVSNALARGPPCASGHVEPNLADTRPASVYGRIAALAA